MDRFYLSLLVFVATILCIFLKPFKKSEWVYASVFAVIALFLNLFMMSGLIFMIFGISSNPRGGGNS